MMGWVFSAGIIGLLPGAFFGGWIANAYLMQSPAMVNVAHNLPGWVAPHPGSTAYLHRSFLDSAWSHIDRMSGHRQALAISALVLSAARRQPRGVFTVTGHRYDDGRRDLRTTEGAGHGDLS